MLITVWLLWLPLAVPQLAREAPPRPAHTQEVAEEHAAAGDWETLSAAWREAVVAWAQAWLERWREDPSAQMGDSPAGEFWDRFAALAETGEPRALLWLLRNYDQTGAVERVRRERIADLFDRVSAAGAAPWVAEAIPFLLRSRQLLDEVELVAQLESWAAQEGEPGLRRGALLALAEVVADDEREWAFELRWSAFADAGELAAAAAEPSPAQLDELAERVEDALSEVDSEHFARWFVDVGDMYVQEPGAPPAPEATYRPILEELAERGSVQAGLWCLRSIWPGDDAARARLRGYLERLADAELDADQLRQFSWYVSSLVHKVGAEPTEAAVRRLQERADEELRPGLLASLGEGLCENDEARERGLLLLREVVERWPESDAAKGARGKLFRYENLLVGKPAPDFETQDVDGNAFKLSDYKGKVTVVDFWGFW